MTRKQHTTPFAWEQVLEALGAHLSERQVQSWFGAVEVRCCRADELVLAFGSSFAREWVEKKYLQTLGTIVSDLGGAEDPKVTVLLAESASTTSERPRVQPETGREEDHFKRSLASIKRAPEHPAQARTVRTQPRARVEAPLDRAHRLEGFEVGPANRLAHAAVIAALEGTNPVHGPIVIEGGVGTGKTHLLQAAVVSFREAAPGVKARYLGAEQFLNEYVTALEAGRLSSFRREVRALKLLAMDDLQCFEGKGRTQEEFLHTFDAIVGAGGILLIGSGEPVFEMTRLQPRLRSRVTSGLVTRLETPGEETRHAIAGRKAASLGYGLDEDVLAFIARHATGNVREVEGAVTRVVGHAVLSKRPIDLPFAKSILTDLDRPARRVLGLPALAEAVCRHFDVTLSELKGRSRVRRIARSRQLLMSLAREHTPLSLQEIGRFLGGRDHSTILYGVEKATERVQADGELRSLVDHLMSELSAS